MRTRRTAPQNDSRLDPNNRLKRKIETTTPPNNIINNISNSNSNSNSSGRGSGSEESSSLLRTPLSKVVSDCGRRWFLDALKEAEWGDVAMQVLVAQMYFHGYGSSKNLPQANYWMTKASRVRSSVWNVSNKRPGYQASDSDSESGECP